MFIYNCQNEFKEFFSLATQSVVAFVWVRYKDRKYYYIQKQWPKRESLIPGEKNVINTLLKILKIYLSSLHVELGLIKNFVKAVD